MEDPLFIRLSIAHYEALLATNLAEEARANVQRLLAHAERDLASSGRVARAAARRRASERPRSGNRATA